jgi:RNA polymerase sigma factor (sigma-70 family)
VQDLQEVYSRVAQLVTQAGDGDRDSWEALVEQFAPMVWAVARGYGLSSADAADVSQTTWMRLVQHLHCIEQPERVGGWLATTARRESLRVLRAAGRQIPTLDEEVATLADTPFAAPDWELLTAERDGALWAIFAQLPARCQWILQSVTGDAPMSYEDLSTLLEMPIGSIGPTRARCLERLRRLAAGAGLAVSSDGS